MTNDDFAISAQGVRVPKLLYGTAWKKERTAALVEQALGLGFRGLDTACQPKHYDEPGVGAGLAAALNGGLKRADVYLQTKFTPLDGQNPKRLPYDPKARLAEQIEQSFAASLANLQTDYLDCLVLHSPLSDERQTLKAWAAMETLFAAGKVKQLGISNCYAPARFKSLYEKASVKPAIIQNRFYADTGYDRAIRAFCRKRGILYQSFWTLTANPHLLAHPTILAMAKKYGRAPEPIFFRFLVQIGIMPLTGTNSAAHMREDLAIFEFELSEEECAAGQDMLRSAS
jgi:diketogulonate reductase-like aldo/keto reductase